jgi:hypothetical protein
MSGNGVLMIGMGTIIVAQLMEVLGLEVKIAPIPILGSLF